MAVLPLDVYLSSNPDGREWTLEALKYVWRIQYWTAFVLVWLLFPMLGEWVQAGGFTWGRKLWICIRENLIFYSVMLCLGALGIGLIFIFPEIKGKKTTWPNFAIAMSNTYGLVLIMIFLSYGVVMIPKKYFGMKDLGQRQTVSYFNVYMKDEQVQELKFKVEELIANLLLLIE